MLFLRMGREHVQDVDEHDAVVLQHLEEVRLGHLHHPHLGQRTEFAVDMILDPKEIVKREGVRTFKVLNDLNLPAEGRSGLPHRSLQHEQNLFTLLVLLLNNLSGGKLDKSERYLLDNFSKLQVTQTLKDGQLKQKLEHGKHTENLIGVNGS